MKAQRWRLGIRAQLTMIMLLGTLLTTVATLFVANTTITNTARDQTQTQERENMRIALLVLHTQYGQNISISSEGKNGTLVADFPTKDNSIIGSNTNKYGRYPLDNDTDYVDAVKNLVGGAISVYKCQDASGNDLSAGCMRVATTFPKANTGGNTTSAASLARDVSTDSQAITLDSSVTSSLRNKLQTSTQISCLTQSSNGASAQDKCGLDVFRTDAQEADSQYVADYYPLVNPQGDMVGVLSVSRPYKDVTDFTNQTTFGLILLGAIIMVAAVILALLFASAIINTLQHAARQVTTASERIGGIAAQQAGGAAQQVWAVNAINKALQNFTEMARDISQRTDQLALMGNQVIQRRGEIAPAQIDSILAYITRSVRDISIASRQQATQYERMAGAMQAVIEIADQVANSSQQSTESSEQLDHVVRQLQQLVGIQRLRGLRGGAQGSGFTSTSLDGSAMAMRQPGMESGMAGMAPTVRAMRPGTAPGMPGMPTSGPMGPYPGALPPGGQMPGLAGRPGAYGAPAPRSGAMRPGGAMPGGAMPPMPRWGGPPMDGGMGRGYPGERAPMSGGMGGAGQRMPLPPLGDGPGMPPMPPAPQGRMPAGPGSGIYPRPQGPQSGSQRWDDQEWDDPNAPR
ncbi:MAG TPA: hypothetical protein VFY89_00815, partial [Ktedonobacterales bacterium]